MQGILTGRGRGGEGVILNPIVVPHFDNHLLASQSMYMYDNAQPHKTRAVVEFLQQEATDYHGQFKHLRDILQHEIHEWNPPI